MDVGYMHLRSTVPYLNSALYIERGSVCLSFCVNLKCDIQMQDYRKMKSEE